MDKIKCETCGKLTAKIAFSDSDSEAGKYQCEHGDHVSRYPV